ncbi:hypothetical protein EVAR_83200_1 [Eumeta japonica]|uniref:Uncharacterized protein n=1 Tax=Eumeta variegata TaxID=151549 RepID=A0A4C1YSW1_EUMVA|nr:hypothetical protein EVAR_83200_1 [Eumeta japonica]
MQAAWHRGHQGRAECTGTAAPGAYWTLKCPTRRAPTTLRTAGRPPGHRGNNYSNCEPMLRRARRRRRRGQRLTDTCAAAAGSPVRAASTRSAFIGIRRAAVACAWIELCPLPAIDNLRQPSSPSAAERMRGYAPAGGSA